MAKDTHEITAAVKDAPRQPTPHEAAGNLKYALNYWWRYLDQEQRKEFLAYFLAKAEVAKDLPYAR